MCFKTPVKSRWLSCLIVSGLHSTTAWVLSALESGSPFRYFQFRKLFSSALLCRAPRSIKWRASIIGKTRTYILSIKRQGCIGLILNLTAWYQNLHRFSVFFFKQRLSRYHLSLNDFTDEKNIFNRVHWDMKCKTSWSLCFLGNGVTFILNFIYRFVSFNVHF